MRKALSPRTRAVWESQRAASRQREQKTGLKRWIGLHSHDAVATIDVEDLAGDRGGQRTAEKNGGVGDFFGLDAALQGGALGGVLNHLVDIADGAGGAGSVRPRRDQIHANFLTSQIARQLLGVDLQGGLGG